MPVLAVRALHVAALRPDGQDPAAGIEVVQGLFLYRVHGYGGQPSINLGIEGAAAVLPHPADAVFLVPDNAVVRAKPALNASPAALFIKGSFMVIHNG